MANFLAVAPSSLCSGCVSVKSNTGCIVGRSRKSEFSGGSVSLSRASGLLGSRYVARNRQSSVIVCGVPETKADRVEQAVDEQGVDSKPDRPKKPEEKRIELMDVNPVTAGRRSRQFLDNAWRKFTQLGQVMSSPLVEDDVVQGVTMGPYCDFEEPNAQYTTVLVAGATGRVGRVLVRKLLLRGYTVKALVHSSDTDTLKGIPTSVQVVQGDVGDPTSLRAAMEDVTKVVCCVRAKTFLTAELNRVDHEGVRNLAKAFQDYNNTKALRRAGKSSKSKLRLFDFNRQEAVDAWRIVQAEARPSEMDLGGTRDRVSFAMSEKGAGAVFSGTVYSRGRPVEITSPLKLPATVNGFEAMVMRVCGDGKPYNVVLYAQAEDGQTYEYMARFNTRQGYSLVRVPFSNFRPKDVMQPRLNVAGIRSIGFRFEPRKQTRSRVASPTATSANKSLFEDSDNRFRLELVFVKVAPTGQEPDFILLSCAGAGVPEDVKERLVKAKAQGEEALRNSGLGYTIIRPGPLLEQAGGGKALVFDQGNRISQPISCADVADVCLKALHDPSAYNKSFEVCNESPAATSGLYELVAHLPDKSNNYLTPALSVLERNT
eukprot:jgi/Mesvir1/2812/Mv13914-RA.1